VPLHLPMYRGVNLHGFCVHHLFPLGRGGSKKRDCFRGQKNHPGGRFPPPSQNREVAEALFCGEVFRGLVASYSSELCVSSPQSSPAKCQASGIRREVRRSASEKKCRSHLAPLPYSLNRWQCVISPPGEARRGSYANKFIISFLHKLR
jgi:hypothetical protein